ncbi:uncharacterized protein LOC120614119 [Pteropus medius]|uniref:uncharacterized protein LOC120614119 n=1 Tax=Pteropus vampyrus TaxID=132908 RepID=UPI00196A4338|nr:uncharacterized protein LOC120614119 [Pteropus giganteus]XP_039732834.1 uncharacterized protein LOC120614119 [Pteropus giganteus]XP_039732835.1 uncharacterized protein LOC120614119 [Pteropus giganteus]
MWLWLQLTRRALGRASSHRIPSASWPWGRTEPWALLGDALRGHWQSHSPKGQSEAEVLQSQAGSTYGHLSLWDQKEAGRRGCPGWPQLPFSPQAQNYLNSPVAEALDPLCRTGSHLLTLPRWPTPLSKQVPRAWGGAGGGDPPGPGSALLRPCRGRPTPLASVSSGQLLSGRVEERSRGNQIEKPEGAGPGSRGARREGARASRGPDAGAFSSSAFLAFQGACETCYSTWPYVLETDGPLPVISGTHPPTHPFIHPSIRLSIRPSMYHPSGDPRLSSVHLPVCPRSFSLPPAHSLFLPAVRPLFPLFMSVLTSSASSVSAAPPPPAPIQPGCG